MLSMPAQTPHRAAEEHRAADDLQFIRHAMERANRFHAVPGIGLVIMGATAIAAAGLATTAPAPLWLSIWVADAVLAVSVGLFTMYRKARSVNLPVASPSGQAFLFSFSPPIAAGIVITLAFAANGVTHLLAGMWLILYGLAALTGGAFSVRAVSLMGGCFLLLGGVALLAPPALANLFMALGFGALHVAFGAYIAHRHGG